MLFLVVFQLSWNNFFRLLFRQVIFNVSRILLVLEKWAAFLSSNICLHNLFRARIKVVLNEGVSKLRQLQLFVVHASSHIHSGKNWGPVPSSLWMFGGLSLPRLSYFKPSLRFFSHLLVYSPLPICPGMLRFSPQLHHLFLSYYCFWKKKVHEGHSAISLWCHRSFWL